MNQAQIQVNVTLSNTILQLPAAGVGFYVKLMASPEAFGRLTTYAAIAALVGCSERTVATWLPRLAAAGVIQREVVRAGRVTLGTILHLASAEFCSPRDAENCIPKEEEEEIHKEIDNREVLDGFSREGADKYAQQDGAEMSEQELLLRTVPGMDLNSSFLRHAGQFPIERVRAVVQQAKTGRDLRGQRFYNAAGWVYDQLTAPHTTTKPPAPRRSEKKRTRKLHDADVKQLSHEAKQTPEMKQMSHEAVSQKIPQETAEGTPPPAGMGSGVNVAELQGAYTVQGADEKIRIGWTNFLSQGYFKDRMKGAQLLGLDANGAAVVWVPWYVTGAEQYRREIRRMIDRDVVIVKGAAA